MVNQYRMIYSMNVQKENQGLHNIQKQKGEIFR